MRSTRKALEFRDVHKTYGRHQVLRGISLTVQQGEYVGLVGLNGAGKTTLIKALLDFITIESGTIEIFGLRQREVQARRRLAFLPENFSPPYYLKGCEFLAMMCKLYGVAPENVEISRLMQVLDLESWALKKPVKQYSKGMAQKLGLMGCLLSGRDLLVLDEPMNGLDPRARLYFKRKLQDLRQQDQTVFFSTHLLADVEAVCDRIAILHGGRIAFNGTPTECRQKYATPDLESAYLACISDEHPVASYT